MRIGLGLRVGRLRGRSNVETAIVTPEAETTALVARMSVAPDSARQGHINTLVKSLKTAGVWSRLDALYVLAAHDSAAALLNWKADAFNATPVSAPAFEVDRGYTGDGAASYLLTGFNPATAGGLFVQDSAHIGLWSRTADAAAAGAMDMGTTTTFIQARASNNVASFRVNMATSSTPAHSDGSGHFVATRTGPTTVPLYRNGSLLFTSSAASAAPDSFSIRILARGGVAAFSTRQIAAAHIGSGLDASDAAALHSSLQTYLQAVGAA